MGMDNKFVFLSKSRVKMEDLKKFMETIAQWDKSEHEGPGVTLYEMSIEEYGEYFGLEGEFRNTILEDLEYWLKSLNKQYLVGGAVAVINYQNSDYASLFKFFVDDGGHCLFDIFDGTICDGAYDYIDESIMEYLLQYFN